jgi:hypothetical protein
MSNSTNETQVAETQMAPLDSLGRNHVTDGTNHHQPKSNNLVDQTNYVPVRKIISIFLSCATVSITGLLDETMVAVALPTISAELGGGSQIGWVATAFFV